jgi:hypothetical protein
MEFLEDEARTRKVIRELLEDLPDTYAARHGSLRQLSRIFHEEVGRRLLPMLISSAAELTDMNLDGRRAWASARNQDLKLLHLAFRCPRTGRPAALIADSKTSKHDYLRYRLQIYQGGRQIRTYTSCKLPPLDLVEDDLRSNGSTSAISTCGPAP